MWSSNSSASRRRAACSGVEPSAWAGGRSTMNPARPRVPRNRHVEAALQQRRRPPRPAPWLYFWTAVAIPARSGTRCLPAPQSHGRAVARADPVELGREALVETPGDHRRMEAGLPRGRAQRKPQLRGAHAHLCRLAVYQSTPSDGTSSGSGPARARRRRARDTPGATGGPRLGERKDQRALGGDVVEPARRVRGRSPRRPRRAAAAGSKAG